MKLDRRYNRASNIQELIDQHEIDYPETTLYKVTGHCWNGLAEVRMTPRYFSNPRYGKYDAVQYLFNRTERGFCWKKNPKGSRNAWSVVKTHNMEWPKGARDNGKSMDIETEEE